MGIDFSFDRFSGLARNETSRKMALEGYIAALQMLQAEFPMIVDGQHGKCRVLVRGVGGSVSKGRFRLGLFPEGTTYDRARSEEMKKRHGPGGVLVHPPDQMYPSDIDLSLNFLSADGRKSVTVGDTMFISRAVHKRLEEIYNKTRVFVSGHDFDPMEVKTIGEVLEILRSYNLT